MHYAVPAILATANHLFRFYTDVVVSDTLAAFIRAVLPHDIRSRLIRSALGRRPVGVPPSLVKSFPLFAIQVYWQNQTAKTEQQRVRNYVKMGQQFGRRVADRNFDGASAVYTFNSAALEILQKARRQGLTGVVEQVIAARGVEEELLREEVLRWPGWEPDDKAYQSKCSAFADREQAEWDAADRIVCGSEFVVKSIRDVGGPFQKCAVVPYGIALRNTISSPERQHHGPLKVLFCGRIGLRKGIQYLLDAMRLLGGRSIRVKAAGTIELTPAATAALAKSIELVGSIPRDEAFELYRWADVLVLPSLCEGSATVSYEALANGVPVITTPNAGTLVENGVNGFIIPIRDSSALADRLARLSDDRDLLVRMSTQALARSGSLTLAAYGQRLLSVLNDSSLQHRQ
jgi:glycosyltransferase involved in cell wall biosynthesis